MKVSARRAGSVLLLALLILAGGCNTMRGAARDVKAVVKAILPP